MLATRALSLVALALLVCAVCVASVQGAPHFAGLCCVSTDDCGSPDLVCNPDIQGGGRCVYANGGSAPQAAASECERTPECWSLPGLDDRFECRFGKCVFNGLVQDNARRGHACTKNEECGSTDLQCLSGACVFSECQRTWIVDRQSAFGWDFTSAAFGSGPGTPQSGSASVQALDTDFAGHLWTRFTPTLDAAHLWRLAFSTFTSSDAALFLLFELDTGAAQPLALFFDTKLVGGIQNSVWQTWDAMTARGWHLTRAGATTCTPQAPCTFDEVAVELASMLSQLSSQPNEHMPGAAVSVDVRGRMRTRSLPVPALEGWRVSMGVHVSAQAQSATTQEVTEGVLMAVDELRINNEVFNFETESGPYRPGECCDTNADCSAHGGFECKFQRCHFRTSSVISGKRPPLVGAECSRTTDCGAGLECMFGRCVAPANTNMLGQFCQYSYQCGSYKLACELTTCILAWCPLHDQNLAEQQQ